METYAVWMSIFFVITALISAAIHWHFVSVSYRLVPIATHIMLVFSIFTCISPFPLLVLDVDAALSTPLGQPKSPFEDTALPWWIFLFIASQVMAWIVLPIAQAYDVGGEFDDWERMKGAIRINVKMYLVLGLLVGGLLGYVMFLKGVHTLPDILHVTIAAANAFGLFLLVVFLACGLLGIPRRLWKMADPEALLEEEYRRARTLHDELDVAKTDVVLLRAEANTLMATQYGGGSGGATAAGAGAASSPPHTRTSTGHPGVTSTFEEDKANLQTIINSITEFQTEVPLHQQSHLHERPDDCKHQSLVGLHEDIMSAIKVCRRLDFQWHECVKQCISLSNVVAGTNDSLYWRTIRKPLMRVGCAIAIILTIMVLFSELVVPFQTLDASRQISIVEVLLLNSSTRFVAAIVFLGYMGACGYWAIFQFHVFDLFVVVPRISDAASLCFVVTFLTRLVLPLCYNFLWIADLTNRRPQLVTYSEVFGKMDVVDFLGTWFNRFMPVFIPVLAVLIEAKVIHRFLQWVGVEGFETGEESEAARRQAVEEGRAIVAREANMEMRSVRHLSSPGAGASPTTAGGGGGGGAAGGGGGNTGHAASGSGSSTATSQDSTDEMLAQQNRERARRNYETWKAAHGGGAAGTRPNDNDPV